MIREDPLTDARRVATLALAIAAIVPLAGCRPEDDTPVALEILPEGVDMALLGMDVNMTREGVRRVRLMADTAQFRSDGEWLLRRMQMTFYDLEGQEISIVTADAGTYQENTDDMEAEGSVVVLDRREDQRLETTQLRYVKEEDRLYGDEPFVLYKDDGRTEIRGSSFESDPGMSEVVTYNSSGQSERVVTPPAAPPPAEPAGAAEAGASDSSGVAADSGGVAPDSGGVVPDSTGLPAESTGVAAETVITRPDTTGLGPDSAGARPDSLRVPPDSASAPPDTSRTPSGR
jgi:LPS export ABC transporter protein LptC